MNPLLSELAKSHGEPETGPFYILREDVHPCFDDTTYKGRPLGKHQAYWEFLVSHLFGFLNPEHSTLFQNLWGAYTGAPRGRVVISGVDECANITEWTVYLPGDYVENTKIILMVERWYRLPEGKYRVDTDPHYERSNRKEEETVKEALAHAVMSKHEIVSPMNVLLVRAMYRKLKGREQNKVSERAPD